MGSPGIAGLDPGPRAARPCKGAGRGGRSGSVKSEVIAGPFGSLVKCPVGVEVAAGADGAEFEALLTLEGYASSVHRL